MNLLRRLCVVVALLVLGFEVSAQDLPSTSLYKQAVAVVEKYKGEKGVKAFVADGGFMLKTVKMMLRKEFGRDFVDNIELFAVMFYKDVKGDVEHRIVEDIKQMATTLQEVDISSQLKPEERGRGFIRFSEDREHLTDLLIVTEAPVPKFIYFGGNFKAEKIRFVER
jgi:hypothetical protein